VNTEIISKLFQNNFISDVTTVLQTDRQTYKRQTTDEFAMANTQT